VLPWHEELQQHKQCSSSNYDYISFIKAVGVQDRCLPGSGSELNARPRLAAAHVATPDWLNACRVAPGSVDSMVMLLDQVQL
jgi:hypothetical protein